MRKYFRTVSVFLICTTLFSCFLFFSCTVPEISRSASGETMPETTSGKNVDPLTGWDLNNCTHETNKHWPKSLYTFDDLLKLVERDEFDAAKERVQKEKKQAYIRYRELPPLCWMIRELNISKEDFLRVTDRVKYPERTVDLLFGEDQDAIRSGLKFDNVFLYDGRLYTISDLMSLKSWKMKELIENSDLLDFLRKYSLYLPDFDSLYTYLYELTENKTAVDPVTGWDLNNCTQETDKHWPEPLYRTDELLKIVGRDELDAAEESLRGEKKRTYSWWYNRELPPLYWMIRELNISKEEFLRTADRDEYPAYIVDVLFGEDQDAIRSGLKFDNVFLYDGRLYTISDLRSLGSWKLKEMAENSDVLDFLYKYKLYYPNFDPVYNSLDKLIERTADIDARWAWDLDCDLYWHDCLDNLYEAELIIDEKEGEGKGQKIIYDAYERIRSADPDHGRRLPLLYLMIRELNIGKEDFRRVADRDKYPDWVIDMLFGNESPEAFRAAMKSDCALLYNDLLYTLRDLNALGSAELKEMAENSDLRSFLNDYKLFYPSNSVLADEVLQKLG